MINELMKNMRVYFVKYVYHFHELCRLNTIHACHACIYYVFIFVGFKFLCIIYICTRQNEV